MSVTSVPIPPNIGAIAAPQLIGSLVNYCLYGVLAVQVYIFRLSFPNDKLWIKTLVYFVFIFETVQTVLNGADVYYWFATGYGNVLRFSDPHWSWFWTPVMSSLMSFIVQMFFCYRIWVINKQAWWWCILIGAVSIMQTVGGVIGGVKAHLQSDVAKRAEQTVEVYLWLVGDAVADIMIAGTMTFSLLRARGELHRNTNDVVSKIIRLTVETNTLSTVVAILSLILYAGVPSTTYFICPTLALGKIYANTLLVTFNNRAYLTQTLPSHHSSSGDMSRSGRSLPAMSFSDRSGTYGERTTSSLSPNHVKITQSFTSDSPHLNEFGLDSMETKTSSHKHLPLAV